MSKAKGRPTLLNDRLKDIIVNLAKEGKTTEQIADVISVSQSTIKNWMGKDKKLGVAIRAAKAVADELVEASLFQRACGYSHPEVKVFFDAKSLQTVEHVVTKHYPPDPVSMIFWLKNRDPDRWREKQEIEIVKDIPITIASDETDL